MSDGVRRFFLADVADTRSISTHISYLVDLQGQCAAGTFGTLTGMTSQATACTVCIYIVVRRFFFTDFAHTRSR